MAYVYFAKTSYFFNIYSTQHATVNVTLKISHPISEKFNIEMD